MTEEENSLKHPYVELSYTNLQGAPAFEGKTLLADILGAVLSSFTVAIATTKINCSLNSGDLRIPGLPGCRVRSFTGLLHVVFSCWIRYRFFSIPNYITKSQLRLGDFYPEVQLFVLSRIFGNFAHYASLIVYIFITVKVFNWKRLCLCCLGENPYKKVQRYR